MDAPHPALHAIQPTLLSAPHVQKVYNLQMEFVFHAQITVNSAIKEYVQPVSLASKQTQQVSAFLNVNQHVQPVLITNLVSAFLAIVVQITIM